MSLHNEIEFENDICDHLAAHGWLYSKNDAGYDKALALFPEDMLAWVKETQSETWQKFEAYHGPSAEKEFVSRLAKVLATEGTLSVLRNGFKATGAGTSNFETVQFRPAFGFNEEIAARYAANRLRVVRQLHYSVSNGNSLDLVLFVNGIPVATLELKTDFTQAIEAARVQYKNDRLPRDPTTNKEEPLLTFKRGALVHFAVSTEEVWMTTKLAGASTYFLPFNMGDDGRKGNPPNSSGYPTSYLWERVLQRDEWLRILGSFVQLEVKKETLPDGKKVVKENIIFPRYHQLDAVTKLIDAARTEGAGQKYLFQHSAGSGKSNTIGWAAHQLSTLHDVDDRKVFDSIIVITDRTVLDEQLKDTIRQFQAQPGVVVAVDSKMGAKSGFLAKALKDGAMIIVVTLQTFPFVAKEIAESKGLATKRFAVIIDEAHSSQSGSAARKLKGVLASTGQEEDEEEATVEDLPIAESATRKLPKNTSFIAFTATPKSKTLEIFGRHYGKVDEKGKPLPEPFHLYTMRQAIDEGFILDVLQSFMPYRVAYKLAHGGKDWDDNLVEKSEGMKALARWVRLHPHNIAQKVEIVVEHFRQSVAHLLDGKAKAMVVTASRQEAVRYKLAMDKYIAVAGYKDLATLVAFSGDVIDKESGPDKFSEGTMNTGLHGRSIREAFNTDDYQVLIVANKFQTGFDQPLLCAMYVDKRLDGITAVQTLSRLNRTRQGKDKTFVLDFVNDAETIRKAFEPYYENTELLATTDPNLVYDLQTKLSGEGVYSDQEAENVAAIFLRYGEGKSRASQKELVGALSAPVDRFKKRWVEAEEKKDKEALDRLTIFHKNLGAYCRLYDFLSQIVSYDDASLETSYIFFKHLEPLVRPDRVRQQIDLSGVVLTHYKAKAKGALSIGLGTDDENERSLKPVTDVGTQAPRDPVQVKLEELVEKLNDLFVDDIITDTDAVGMFNHVAGKMMESEELAKQARANSKQQFLQSPTVHSVGVDASILAIDNYQTMGKKIFGDKAKMDQFMALLAAHVYDEINKPNTQKGPNDR